MDPTTLVTFLFRAAPDCNPRSVELLGSWDNFATAYTMHHDRRRGAGSWSGCFKFDNIIFDGQPPLHRVPRSGGLKQGGTYWYYFRLDHDVEAYDDTLETVTTCPLLPGQRMNVIEVPTELVPPPTRCRSACGDVAGTLADRSPHTLDPCSKFASLEPPPLSKVHARCISELALHLDTTPIKQRDSVHSSHSYRLSLSSDGSSSVYSQSDYRLAFSERSSSPVYDASRVQTPEEMRDTLQNDDTNRADDKSIDGVIDDFDSEGFQNSLRVPRFPHSNHAASGSAVSIQNIQFYGSRPSTSQSDQQWRPRVYSIPKRSNSDLQQHFVHETPRRPRTAYQECDPDSPSYSVDTVSTPGISTPPRLSMGYSRRGSEHSDDSYHHDHENIITPPPPSRAPPPPPAPGPPPGPPRTSRSTRSRRDPRNFFGYALPAAAVESAQSLMSKISAHTPRLSMSSIRYEDNPLTHPSPVLQLALPSFEETTNESLIEDIFSELGYA